ncbi:hypothetical protein BHE74_00054336 [Ensete ventricosum]|nr:hypothetical protein BHE74_00054336 [Ensete ventricosum]
MFPASFLIPSTILLANSRRGPTASSKPGPMPKLDLGPLSGYNFIASVIFLHFSHDRNLLHDDLICVGNRFYVLISATYVMHPLRFPNSGIIAKQRQRGGEAASHGQPPCRAGHPWPGRLRPSSPARGRPITAKAPCRGSRPRAWLAPTGATPAGVGSSRGQVARGGRSCEGSAREVPPEGSNAAAYTGQRRRSDVKGEG